MKHFVVLITFLLLISCKKSDDKPDSGIIEFKTTTGINQTDSATVFCSNGMCHIYGIYSVSIKLTSIDTGQFEFNIGTKNIMDWRGLYDSNYKEESGGILYITENTGEYISGHFEVRVDNEYDQSFDTVRGVMKRIPILYGEEQNFDCIIGEINGVTKSFNRVEHRTYDMVERWLIVRPGDELIWLYINKDSMEVKEYALNKKEMGLKSLSPSIEYFQNHKVYNLSLDGATLAIERYDGDTPKIRTG